VLHLNLCARLLHITRRHARRSLWSLGLRHIFTSAIATVKTSHTPGTLGVMQKKEPTAQIAHLVFADTQANAGKTKRAIFCRRLNRNKVLMIIL